MNDVSPATPLRVPARPRYHVAVKFAALSALALLAIAGCKSTPATHVTLTPASRVPSGWDVAMSRDKVVSLGIPPGWRSGIDRASEAFREMKPSENSDRQTPAMDRLTDEIVKDAEAQEEKTIEAMEKKGIIVNAINGSRRIPGEARTHFYVKRSRSDSNVTWEEAIENERHDFAFAPKPTEVKLPMGKALKFIATDTLRDGGVLHQISYVVIDGKDVYSLRFITEEAGDVIDSISDPVAQTWRVTPSKA